MKRIIIGLVALSSISTFASDYYVGCSVLEVVHSKTWDLSDAEITYAVYGKKDLMDNRRPQRISNLFEIEKDAIKEVIKYRKEGICRSR